MTDRSGGKPRPVPTDTTRPFWEGVNAGELWLQYDPGAGAFQFYPRAASLATGRRDLEWRRASGKGTVYSFTVTCVPMAGFEDDAPYILALIDLEEGVRVLANMTGVGEDEMEIGMPVRVAFDRRAEDTTYFCFTPDR